MIYLASPYTHPDKMIEEGRYQAAMALCATYSARGEHIYSPIVHWHVVAKEYKLPTDAKHWHDHNMHMLAKADSLHVLKIDGVNKSKGVIAEMKEANRLGIPIFSCPRFTTSACNEIANKIGKPLCRICKSNRAVKISDTQFSNYCDRCASFRYEEE